MRQGKESTRHPGMGVQVISLGPNSPMPGERLQIAIYDENHVIQRRLEQIEGRTIDPGYVDFFMGPNCRPAIVLRPLVDIAPDGTQTELHPNFTADCMPQWLPLLAAWVKKHGIPQSKGQDNG